MNKLNRMLAKVVASTLLVSTIFNINTNTVRTEALQLTANASSKYEFRGAWMSTVYNLDWPVSGAGVQSQKDDYTAKMDSLKSAGFNAVMFQVRPMGDALYPSNYAAWSQYITGNYGTDPGYNPTDFALTEAHKRNMEFHAWFNPFRISASASFDINNYLSKLPSTSPLKAHPEWIVKYSGSKTYYWLNLGIPEVRKYVIDTIMEVVNNYDIDGVHLDDYFYPYPVYTTDSSGNNVKVNFPDSNEYAKYGTGFASIEDWRRDNVNQFVASLSSAIRAAKPQVKFGISPFGIWKNGISEGGAGTNGLSSYYDLYTDSKKWIDNQWIDYIIPQIYWNIGYSIADYQKLADWWAQQVQGKNVNLYIGQAAYKIGDSTYGSAWSNPSEIPNQIQYDRQNSPIKGSALFSVRDVLANKLGIYDALRTSLYNTYALTPTMTWKDSEKPNQPQIYSVNAVSNGNELKWNKSSSNDVTRYLIYRFNAGETTDISNPAKIIKEIKADGSQSYSYTDIQAGSPQNYIYVVTAVDRMSNESFQSGVDTGTPAITSVNTNFASPQKINSTIQISAGSTGGNVPEYRLSIYDGYGWKVIHSYSQTCLWKWTPSGVGNYKIKVDVRNVGSTKDFEDSREVPFVIKGLNYVTIDPGHGGIDSGAVGYSGAYEKVFNLTISLMVRDLLKARAIDVLMTRDTDATVSLDDRTNLANNANTDVLVSIHQNSADSSSAQGIETFSYPGSVLGAALATAIQTNIIRNTNAVNRGAKTANYHMVRESNMPAALVECGFISNPNEEAKLKTNVYQNTVAYSIVSGILDFLKVNREDTDLNGSVDIRDLASVSSKYNSKRGDQNWSDASDINHDNIVDIKDLIMVSKEMK